MSKHDSVGTMTGNTETTLLEAGVLTTTADIPIKHPGTREVVITARQQTAIATIWIVIMSTGINVIPLSGKLITIFVISNIFSNYFSQNQHSFIHGGSATDISMSNIYFFEIDVKENNNLI